MSFFKRLTGGGHYLDEDVEITDGSEEDLAEVEEENIGELSVDMYQTADNIIIEAMVPGVKPDQLDVEINREMVTVRGERGRAHEVEDENFYHRELYWGSFARTIMLPQEIEPDQAEAREKNGMLVITLPKINKEKIHKLRIKSNA